MRTHSARGEISAGTLALLGLLLLLPGLAFPRLAQLFDWRYLLACLVLVSLLSIFLYRHDKEAAQSGAWRTPESTLHLLELLGGWPAAFLAQRLLRHKIRKTSYQVTYWGIVLLHELAALDSLQGWKFSRKALLFLPQ